MTSKPALADIVMPKPIDELTSSLKARCRIVWLAETLPVPQGRSPSLALVSKRYVESLRADGWDIAFIRLRMPMKPWTLAFTLCQFFYQALRSDVVVFGNVRLGWTYRLIKALGRSVMAVCYDLPDEQIRKRIAGESTLIAKQQQKSHKQKLYAIGQADAVVCISESSKNDVQRQVPDKPCYVSYVITSEGSGSDVSRQQARSWLKQHGLALPDSQHWGCVISALAPHKNVPCAIAAVKNLGDCGLVIVGTPKDETMKRQVLQAVEESDTVWHPRLEDAALSMIRKAADFSLCPSLFEGFGMTGVEAQQAGLPVIASKIPCHQEVLGDGALYVDDYQQDSSWSEAIRLLLNDSKMQTKLVTEGKNNVSRFQPEQAVAGWQAAFAQAMQSKTHS